MKLALSIALLVLLVPLAFAVEAGWGGYAGTSATLRRMQDPYTRYSYFGENYTKSTVGYGSKGPNYGQTTTGAKSAFSGVFNLDTNSYYNRGRDPSKISNSDPNVRGFAQVDQVVTLLPYDILEYEENTAQRGPRGTARIISRGDAYGAGLNSRLPNTQVFVQTIDLPPIPSTQAYEAWLLDEESGYALSLGILKSGGKFTAQLNNEFSRSVAGFDGVMITQEAYPDIDPSPQETVLFGWFGPTRSIVSELGVVAPGRLR